jgi:hypothetical protein
MNVTFDSWCLEVLVKGECVLMLVWLRQELIYWAEVISVGVDIFDEFVCARGVELHLV